MKISVGLGYLLLVFAHSLCANAMHVGSPNYRTVYVSKRKVPVRPMAERFRGELYSDGSLGWLCSRKINGKWTGWAPVSEARVPPHLVRQMKSQLVKSQRRRAPQIYRERIVSPSVEEFDLDISSESGFGPTHSKMQFGKQFTWEEEDSSSEASPLELVPMSPILASNYRSYNNAAGRQPVLQQSRIEKRMVPGGFGSAFQQKEIVSTSPEDEMDMARYFEEQNTPPIAGKKGIREAFKEAFKTSVPELELASPTYSQRAPQHLAPSKGFHPLQPQQPSDYDLNRMQWRYFLTSFNPRLDNVRIIKNIPPLGMKLSKTVTECTSNFFKAFKLNFISISGMMYSKKISRAVGNSINRELKQWCTGMMTNWYRQLQKMGLIVPKPNKFIR